MAAADEPTVRWRWLLRLALMLLTFLAVLVHVAAQTIIPPVLAFAVIFVVAIVLLGREGRARTIGTVLGGVGALLFLLGNLQFVLEDIAHPDSILNFFVGAAGFVGAPLAFVSMLGALLKWGSGAVRPLAAVGAAALVVLLGVGLVSTLGVDSDERQDGDVPLTAEKVEWVVEGEENPALVVDADGAVFVENKDLTRHTFTVDDTDVAVEVPANADRRVVIDLEAGSYTYRCDVPGHETMEGDLTVE